MNYCPSSATTQEEWECLCKRIATPDSPCWNSDLEKLLTILKPICASCIKIDYQNKTAWSAEDLLQVFLYKMILSRPPKILEYNKDKGVFSGWLRKCCLNLIIDKTKVQKYNPQKRVFLDSPGSDPEWVDRTYDLGIEDNYADLFRLDEIELAKCIQKLSQLRDRRIMYMKFIQEMSNMDIAIAIGYPLKEGPNPLSSFNSTLKKAKYRLREILISAGYHPHNVE